jgi:hypothetical protein
MLKRGRIMDNVGFELAPSLNKQQKLRDRNAHRKCYLKKTIFKDLGKTSFMVQM